jgi:hypothetical protein
LVLQPLATKALPGAVREKAGTLDLGGIGLGSALIPSAGLLGGEAPWEVPFVGHDSLFPEEGSRETGALDGPVEGTRRLTDVAIIKRS